MSHPHRAHFWRIHWPEIERKDATVRRFLQKLRKSGRIVKTPAGYILNDERNEQDEQRERRERNERDEQTDPCTR